MTVAGEQQRREYRSSGRHVTYVVTTLVLISIGGLTRMSLAGAPAFVTAAVAVFALAAVVLVLAGHRRTATVVDERQLTLRGLRRSRQIGWPDVQGIEIALHPGRGQRGTPGRMIVVYDTAGKRYLPPHLHDRIGLDLEREAAAMREAWAAGRGATWAPVPRVDAKIANARAHPVHLSNVALLAAVCVFLAALVTVVMVLITGGYGFGGYASSGLAGTVFKPLPLMLILPGGTYVLTLLAVGARRRAYRRKFEAEAVRRHAAGRG